MKLNINNTPKIIALLDETNGKADTHTFTTWTLMQLAERLTRRLSFCPAKRDHVGAKLTAWSSEPMPRAYKHARIANRVTMQVYPTGVFITGLTRVELWSQQGGETILELTDAQQEHLLNTYRSL